VALQLLHDGAISEQQALLHGRVHVVHGAVEPELAGLLGGRARAQLGLDGVEGDLKGPLSHLLGLLLLLGRRGERRMLEQEGLELLGVSHALGRRGEAGGQGRGDRGSLHVAVTQCAPEWSRIHREKAFWPTSEMLVPCEKKTPESTSLALT
jgi:hypothetical protein